MTVIRQMHLVEGAPKREVARRLGLDVKTARRALSRSESGADRNLDRS
jgi:DNA-directed RNA polymerase specialized sigma24 family protein